VTICFNEGFTLTFSRKRLLISNWGYNLQLQGSRVLFYLAMKQGLSLDKNKAQKRAIEGPFEVC
jgi:hypothetical protein